MGRYRYLCSNDHVTELFVASADRKERTRCKECGKTARHCPGAAAVKPSTWANPVLSDSMGVHPDQRQEAQQHSVRMGVPTQFNELGQAVFTSRQHRREYCNLYKVHDLDGGYGDP